MCKPSQGQKQLAILDEWSPESCNPGIFIFRCLLGCVCGSASCASASLDDAAGSTRQGPKTCRLSFRKGSWHGLVQGGPGRAGILEILVLCSVASVAMVTSKPCQRTILLLKACYLKRSPPSLRNCNLGRSSTGSNSRMRSG